METLTIGTSLVALCREGKYDEAIDAHYGDGIVSIEGAANPGMEQRMEGIDAIRAKNEWWQENHEVHKVDIEGPFACEGSNQFGVRFALDVTSKLDGQRQQMAEVALYTVDDGKIVQEEFFYLMG